MPQMSPMSWMSLFTFFSLMLLTLFIATITLVSYYPLHLSVKPVVMIESTSHSPSWKW
nr:ATP synthase F0 subunit 8 [Onomarchus uninotatus]